MLILGVDPGLSGAMFVLAFADGHVGYSSVFDMPTVSISRGGKIKRDIDIHQLSRVVLGWGVGHAFVEQVGSMPGQGVSSMFAFGKGYGIILGVLTAHGIPYTPVPPQRWKKALGVPASKDGARLRASQLLPDCSVQWPLKKHEARAEAALIAFYGIRELNGMASGKAA